ncbi:hypothetical protein [Hymenobacter crusticola]|uniref:Glycoside hydrolase family 5 domain-containing protein n=1 Tax=Hymenobacter crusticola TaxID=1770526 RepID=A0A243WFH0_9BACT|nr:hypothetical protein [Hymenobacter crusticola]OUJ73671.1 hypothetical protein BXP70_11820 [Hymenobacter crusticola]
MHTIEPHYNWIEQYSASEDPRSPLFETENSLDTFTNTIYGYYIHPQWDSLESDTLFLKILFVDYDLGIGVIEFIGEWNDAIENDIMQLKRNIIDLMTHEGIRKFILIGENVFNFHGSDDSYYEEWFEDVEDGWIAGINFQEHVIREMHQYNIDNYVNFGGQLDELPWRTYAPRKLFDVVDKLIQRRLG